MTKKMRRQQRPAAEEIVELVLGDPAHGGACVARDADGRVIFVRLGLPGERVRARITNSRSRLAWADVIEVLEPSPDRVAAEPQALGAELSMASPDAQRRWKTFALRQQLRRVGGEDLAQDIADVTGGEGPTVQPLPGDQGQDDPLWGRRTRARFVVDRSGRLAMRGHRSHNLVPASDYPLLDPRFAEAGVFTDDRWKQIWKPGDRVTLVGVPGGEALVLVGERAWTLEGAQADPRLHWPVGDGATFSVAANGFWQVHREAPQTLVNAVLEAAGPLDGARVLELYSGSGLLSYVLARGVGAEGHLVTVEISEDAVADASANLATVNQDERAELFVGDVDAAAISDLEIDNKFGVIILDPPREGAGNEVTSAIGATGAHTVVLVSCDPAAGARDLANLRRHGFRVQDIKAFDFFPHTHHFEMVTKLTR